MDVVVLLEALHASGLPEALQDAVAVAVEQTPVVPVSHVKGLLAGAGVGPAAALRVMARLVSHDLAYVAGGWWLVVGGGWWVMGES